MADGTNQGFSQVLSRGGARSASWNTQKEGRHFTKM